MARHGRAFPLKPIFGRAVRAPALPGPGILTHVGLPVFGTTTFLASDGIPVYRLGSTTQGLTAHGDLVFGLPAVVVAATVFSRSRLVNLIGSYSAGRVVNGG